jgi:molybdopterin molybdotransferase
MQVPHVSFLRHGFLRGNILQEARMSDASGETILDYPDAAALVSTYSAAISAPRRVETVSIDQALGRCIAREIVADRDQPPFDRSTRDGYAVNASDLADGEPTSLRVIGQLRAGQPASSQVVQRGEALEIMTGAPLPKGADAVLMVEHAQALHAGPPDSPFTISTHKGRSLKAGENIVPAGSEAKAGAVIVPAGTRLTPMHIGAAVSSGVTTVEVYAQPRIAILATGDELVEPGEPLLDFQIRNSNSYSLAAQVERAGALPVRLPIVRDSLLDLRQSLARAIQADMVLLSGGVSMGKFDFVEQVLRTLPAEFLFTGVRIQPGKPVVFGYVPDTETQKYFFGLPGNPVSTMVTFALFAAPFIRALGGETDPQPLFARAHLTTGFQHKSGLTRFLPALLTTAWDRAEVTPVGWQGSGDLASVARANCFVVIPPEREQLAAGDEVSVLLAYS